MCSRLEGERAGGVLQDLSLSGVPGKRRQEHPPNPTPGACCHECGLRDSKDWGSCTVILRDWLSPCNLHLVTQQCLDGPFGLPPRTLQMQTLVRNSALQVTCMESEGCVGRELRGHFSPTEPWQGGPPLCLNAPSDGEITPFGAAWFTFLELC